MPRDLPSLLLTRRDLLRDALLAASFAALMAACGGGDDDDDDDAEIEETPESDDGETDDEEDDDTTEQPTAAPFTGTVQPIATSAANPTPRTDHPRLWLRAENIPRLRALAVESNPAWSQGLALLAEQARADMDDGKVPDEDSGDEDWEEFPTEMYAELFAFLSLVDPDENARADHAERARELLMHVMNIAVKGPGKEEDDPFRDPVFATIDSDRSRWWGEAFPLTVDWIYPALAAEDKQTIRQVFLRWCREIVEQGYARPDPTGVFDDPSLVSDPLAVRWSGNNYFTAHMRNMGMMALSFDAADDPGDELRGYLSNAIGADLYMLDHLPVTCTSLATRPGATTPPMKVSTTCSTSAGASSGCHPITSRSTTPPSAPPPAASSASGCRCRRSR